MRDVVLVQDPISFKKRHDYTRRAALERAGETSLQSVLFQGKKMQQYLIRQLNFFYDVSRSSPPQEHIVQSHRQAAAGSLRQAGQTQVTVSLCCCCCSDL